MLRSSRFRARSVHSATFFHSLYALDSPATFVPHVNALFISHILEEPQKQVITVVTISSSHISLVGYWLSISNYPKFAARPCECHLKPINIWHKLQSVLTGRRLQKNKIKEMHVKNLLSSQDKYTVKIGKVGQYWESPSSIYTYSPFLLFWNGCACGSKYFSYTGGFLMAWKEVFRGKGESFLMFSQCCCTLVHREWLHNYLLQLNMGQTMILTAKLALPISLSTCL